MKERFCKKIFISFFFLSAFFYGIENKPFVGIGLGLGSKVTTQVDQNIYRESSRCTANGNTYVGTCYGGNSQATYQGDSKNGLKFIFGNETVFDQYHSSGLRIYGVIEMQEVSLGNRTKYNENKANNTFQGECILDGSTCSTNFKTYNMLNPTTPQASLPSNVLMTTFSINLDFFANLPVDTFFKMLWPHFPFLKVGIFAGVGAEFSLLKSNYWINESLVQQESVLYASGNGLFINLGTNIYLSKHDRIEIGYKIPYYQMQQVMWNSLSINNTPNPWSDQTLRQTFNIKKSPEFHIAYIYYF